MERYEIYEGNYERLTKKLTTIKNKCEKYGCDFHFAEVGETFKTVKDDNGEEQIIRFVVVEAEGKAIINGWKFVAEIEHTDNGNVITGVSDEEVPERFYTVPCQCEHCKTDRTRKYTYIVKNIETGEFKQVGKACLKDYTHGLSAELVALMMNGVDELIEGKAYNGSSSVYYLNTDTVLAYAVEMVEHFGYVSTTDDFGGYNPNSTKRKVIDYLDAKRGIGSARLIDHINYVIKQTGFNPDTEEVAEKVKAIREYFKTITTDNNYLNNLKTVTANDYIDYKNIGILVSSVQAYNKAMDKIAKENKRKNQMDKESKESDYVGNVGDKVTVEVKDCKVLYSFDTSYSYYNTVTTYCYKLVDNNGNVYTWKTQKDLDEENTKTVIGTVKAHNEYKGIKQTELTRCKVA